MPNLHWLVMRTCLALLLSVASDAARGDLTATLRTSTGELRIRNTGLSDFFLSAYQITTPGEALSVPNWLRVSGRLDVNGDGSLDPDQAWTVLAPLPPLPAVTGELSEGVFVGDGGLLAPGDTLYLGAIWDTTQSPSVQVNVADNGPVPISVPVSYVPAGDYNENGLVDQHDFTLWKNSFGHSGTGLLADGNGDHVVGLADYTVWRDNLGASGWVDTAFSIGIARSLAIPEPATATTLVLVVLLVSAVRWQQAGH